MPQQDFSKRIGSSPSPSINQVIQNNKGVQAPFATPQAAIAAKFASKPVKK
jgi:hypothetical protein